MKSHIFLSFGRAFKQGLWGAAGFFDCFEMLDELYGTSN